MDGVLPLYPTLRLDWASVPPKINPKSAPADLRFRAAFLCGRRAARARGLKLRHQGLEFVPVLRGHGVQETESYCCLVI